MAQTDASSRPSFMPAQPTRLNALDWITLVLLVVGGLNWGLVGALDLDLVAALLGPGSMASRIVYLLVGVSAVYALFLMVRLGRGGERRG